MRAPTFTVKPSDSSRSIRCVRCHGGEAAHARERRTGAARRREEVLEASSLVAIVSRREVVAVLPSSRLTEYIEQQKTPL
jgi:hypothetical protein